MRPSLVDVVIPNWNGAHLLPACLDSLRRQVLAPGRVLVVDDGSTDDSAALVQRAYPEVELIRLPINRGFCHAVNVGFRTSQAPYVALLNNDAEPDPAWLLEAVRTLEADATLGSCASKMLFRDDPGRINSAGLAVRVDGVARDIGYGRPDGPAFAVARAVFGASGGAAIYCRRALDDVGLFDEDFYAYGEDADWAFRAQLLGYRCVYQPAAVVYHRGHATFGRESPRAVFYSSRNALTFVLKNMPTRLLVKYAPRIALVQVYQVAYCLARGRGWPALRGKLAAVRQMSATVAKRRAIQSRRRVADDVIESRLARGLAHSIHFGGIHHLATGAPQMVGDQ